MTTLPSAALPAIYFVSEDEEWRASRHKRLASFPLTPAIHLQPTEGVTSPPLLLREKLPSEMSS